MGLQARQQPNCDRIRALASASLDSDLSEVERLLLADHVRSCGQCEQLIGAMDRFTGRLRAAEPLVPARAVRIAARRRRQLPIARIGAFAAASLVAGLLGALFSLSQGRPAAAPPPPPVIKVAQLRLDRLHSGDLLFNRLPPDLRPSRAEQLREHLAMV